MRGPLSARLAAFTLALASALPLLGGCRRQPAGEAKSVRPAGPNVESAGRAKQGNATKPADNQIVNLFDAFGAGVPGTRHAFGFSALIRHGGKTILFDAGSSADVFQQNVEALGIDLTEVDFAVASHSHFDHISGFDYLLEVNPNVKIYFPEDIFWGAAFDYDATGTDPAAEETLPRDQRYFSGGGTRFRWTSSGRFWKADVEFVGGHRELSPGIHLIATRSPFVGYFSRYPAVGGHGKFEGQGDTKFIGLPELSLSLSTVEGEVLVVGCSHSLVHVITREAKAHLKRDVHLVLGGYHLLPYGADEILEIVRRMQNDLGVRNVAPTHCTGHLGFKLFREAYGERYHAAGLGSVLPIPPAP